MTFDLLQEKEKAEYVEGLSDAFQPFEVCVLNFLLSQMIYAT